MDISETGMLLAKIALIENREATNETIRAWHEILANIEFADALDALTNHYRNSTEPAKPAHIIRGAREIKEERKKRIIN
jgi:hypothetical protein